MKLRTLFPTMLLLMMTAMLAFTGCKTVAGPPPPLAPGYANTADQVMGETLAAANGFYHAIQCETQTMAWDLKSKSCVPDTKVTSPMTLGPTEAQSFNAFAISLNTANAVYLSYHAGQATQAQAQAAIDTVQAQQNALQNSIQAVK